MYVALGDQTGRRPRAPRRHDPERHPEGVPGAEGVHLPAAAVDATRGRRRALRHRRAPPLASGVDLRVPHPRGRFDGRAGARVHARQRVRLRGVGARRRTRRRRVRAPTAASSSTRTSTSSRRSPSTAPRAASGRAGCATSTARRSRAVAAVAVPHPDRRRVAHRAAARGEHRPRRASRRWPRVLGGTQSLHTDALRRGARVARPSRRRASRCAPSRSSRTRSGVVHVADPLGGSWFVEELTDELEREAEETFAYLDELGRRLDARRRAARRSSRGGSRARSPTRPTTSSAR